MEREETLPDGSKRKVSLLGNGYYSKDSEIKDGYPEFTYGVLKKLGWDKDLTEAELAVINKINPTTPDAVSWSIDLSGGIQRVAIEHGCIPYGNGKARANAFGLPDAIPTHREPIYTPRPELVAKYPTLPNAKQFRVPNVGFSLVAFGCVEDDVAFRWVWLVWLFSRSCVGRLVRLSIGSFGVWLVGKVVGWLVGWLVD